MRLKRLLATFLCATMLITSSGVTVSAAEDRLEDDIMLSAEEAGNAGDVLTDEAPALLEDSESLPEALVEEDRGNLSTTNNDLMSDDGPVSDNDIDELINDKEKISSPFDTESTILKLNTAVCHDLTEWNYDFVEIPAKVEVIPADPTLFVGNNQIKTVTFESGSVCSTLEAGAFANSAITKFTAPKNMKVIAARAFQGCTGLEKVTLRNVEEIGSYAFDGCLSLVSGSITGGEYVKTIGDHAFSNTGFVTVSFGSMTQKEIEVGASAFAGCASLKTAVLPNGVNAIPENCFNNCKQLDKVTIGSRTKVIETNAFHNCTNLTTVTFANVEEIRTLAFDGCAKLAKVDLPATTRVIEPDAFYRCDLLTTMYVRYINPATGVADGDDFEFAGGGGDYTQRLVYYPQKLTIYAYDGEVLKYADRNNIKFVSLLQERTVTLSSSVSGFVTSYGFRKTATGNNSSTLKAKTGETVLVILNPVVTASDDKSFIITKVYDEKDPENEEIEFKYGGTSGTNGQWFSFTMPSRDVTVKFDYLAYTMVKKGTITHDITGYEFSYDPVEDASGKVTGYVTPRSGNKGQLKIYTTYKGERYELGHWNAQYKSDKTSVVTISNTGLITAVGQGRSTLAFSPKGTTNIYSFTVSVNKGVVLKDMYFDFDKLDEEINGGDGYGTVEKGTRSIEIGGVVMTRDDIPIITYYRSDLNNKLQNFNLYLTAIDDDGGEVYVKADWGIRDTAIATLESKSNYDNKNKVTIKKGATGETYIIANVPTDEEDEKGKKITKYAYAVLRVIDPAPKATKDSYQLNKQCSYMADDKDETLNDDGILVEVIQTEEFDIDPASMGYLLYTNTAENERVPFRGINVRYIGESPDNDRGFLYRLSVIDGVNGDADINALAEGKYLDYSGKKQLYMRCKFADEEKLGKFNSAYCFIPLKQIIVFNQPLKPKVKQSGQINIFYNSMAYVPEDNGFAGWTEILGEKAVKDTTDVNFEANKKKYIAATINQITVEQSYKVSQAKVDYTGRYKIGVDYNDNDGTEIADYVASTGDGGVRTRLISAKNYAYFKNKNKRNQRETKDGEYFDSFANNFTVTAAENGKDFIIRRSDNEMAKINNVDVTSGYLLIYYKGYKNPVAYPIQLSVAATSPAYTLSPASGNDSFWNYNAGGENDISFYVGLFNKKTGKSVIEGDGEELADGYPYILQSEPTTRKSGKCIFNKEVPVEKYRDTDTNAMVITKNMSYLGKSVASVVVKKSYWDKEVRYNFTVTETDKLPTAKFKSNKLPLNNRLQGEENARSITLMVNQTPCTVEADEPEFVGSRKQLEEGDYQNISFDLKGEENASSLEITASISGDMKKGNYKFRISPVVIFTRQTITLKPITFTVSVADSQPTIKLNTSSYVFNVNYPGLETYMLNATFGNVPKGADPEKVEIDVSGAELVPTAKEDTPAYAMAEAVAGSFEFTDGSFSYNKDTKKFEGGAILKAVDDYATFSCTYKLTGATFNGTELKPLKITIKSRQAQATVDVKAKNSINTVDKTSYTVYTPSFKNLVNPTIESISALEFNDDREYVDSETFELIRETKRDNKGELVETNVVDMYATHEPGSDGKDSCTNKNHKLMLSYIIGEDKLETAPFIVKPVQTLPTITADPTSIVFYNNASEDNRVATIELTKTSVLKAVIDTDAEHGGIKISDKNGNEPRNAFTVEYSDDGAESIEDIAPTAKKAKAGKAIIRCVAPELLQQGKKVKLILETELEGQFEKTRGSEIVVEVMVK